jgi:FtsZ-interacting cell division protein ZipA
MHLNLTDPRLIAGVVVIVLIIVVAVALYMRNRRKTSAGFRKRFGSEYDRAVLEHGSERKAETKLADRETRVENLKIRALTAAERGRFSADWQSVQSRFVDHPKSAVTEADELVSSLMQARGYPVADFDQRAADISVDHPRLVENYRSAHGVAVRLGRDEASTEELRTAMIQYRSLFDELVQEQPAGGIKSVA